MVEFQTYIRYECGDAYYDDCGANILKWYSNDTYDCSKERPEPSECSL